MHLTLEIERAGMRPALIWNTNIPHICDSHYRVFQFFNATIKNTGKLYVKDPSS